VKETVREFEEYIEEYHTAVETEANGDSAMETVFRATEQLSIAEDNNQHQTEKKSSQSRCDEDDVDDDDFEDDEEETQYSAAEVTVVSLSVTLMRLTLDCNKAVLGAVSTASDSIVTALTREDLTAEEYAALQLLEVRCQVWVGALARWTDILQNRTVDLGAELYPPLEDHAAIAAMYNAQLDSVNQTVDLLLAVEFAPHLSAEVVAAIEVLRESIPLPMVVE
jgi:hypothetical protein